MSRKKLKHINNMIVTNYNNMFGGRTKNLLPVSKTPSAPSISLTSSTLIGQTEHKSRSLPYYRAFLQSIPSPTTAKLSPFTTAALPCITVSTITRKSKSVSESFALQSALSRTTENQMGCGRSAEISAFTSNLLSKKKKILNQRSFHSQIQERQQYHHLHHQHHTPQFRFRILPGLKATSFFTILTLVCLETVLLSTVSNCAKTFYMHWNTSNSIFRIDNTDHIIDVNKGNLAFEFDQVHIICPVYEPGTFENETEKYIIYNVSKVEYETCRITNADPRVIAICDKPQKLMFFTITFRPFTPQPGGLEFLPGNDYYFISTSSKDDLYRRIGGRCSTNNMKVVFKVCCAPEDKNNRTNSNNDSGGGSGNNGVSTSSGNSGSSNSNTAIQQQHSNNINLNSGNMGGQLPLPKLPGLNGGGGMNTNSGLMTNGNSGTSINTNIDQFNRIPIQQSNNIGSSTGNMGMNGMGINNAGSNGQYPAGIRINNVPSSQQHPSQNNEDYDKHPNEVVKNEELTYNSAASSLYKMRRRKGKETIESAPLTSIEGLGFNKSSYKSKSIYQRFKSLLQLLIFTSNHRNRSNTLITFIQFVSNYNPIILTTTVLVTLINLFQYKLSSWSMQRYNSSKLPPSTATVTIKTTGRPFQQLFPREFVSSPPKPLFLPVDCLLMDDDVTR